MKAKFTALEKRILWGVVPLYLLGTLFHFIYEWCGYNSVVGLFVPINESVWEHMKMASLPVILLWGSYFALKKNTLDIDKNRWFTACLVSLITSIATIPLVYYFYTQAFGFESIIVDMLILLLALIIGQLMGLHFYRHCKGITAKLVYIFLAIIVAIFMFFTVLTPSLPIFISAS